MDDIDITKLENSEKNRMEFIKAMYDDNKFKNSPYIITKKFLFGKGLYFTRRRSKECIEYQNCKVTVVSDIYNSYEQQFSVDLMIEQEELLTYIEKIYNELIEIMDILEGYTCDHRLLRRTLLIPQNTYYRIPYEKKYGEEKTKKIIRITFKDSDEIVNFLNRLKENITTDNICIKYTGFYSNPFRSLEPIFTAYIKKDLSLN